MNYSKLCVLGMGYIGLPTASTFATHGLHVVGVDVNHRILEVLQDGEVHIQEPGLRTVVQAAFKSGNLRVSPTPEPADAFIIAVPTPITAAKEADLRYVKAAAESIVPHLRPGNLVILESTSPPRTTTDIVRPILEQSGLVAGRDFYLAYSPERVLPGQILRELIENARVIGGINAASAEAGRELYSVFARGEIVLTDAPTAEMIKLMENTFRDVNIALANEFARLGERLGIDAWAAIEIANRHPRVKILQPGPGVGGHCISVDPWFLVQAAPDVAGLIAKAREVNDAQPAYVIEILRQELKQLSGKRIAAFGLTYKADVDDIRESPAAEIVDRLRAQGARVSCYDPLAPLEVMRADRVGTPELAAQGADALVLLVAHRPLRTLDPVALRERVRTPLALDCHNAWDRKRWKAAGFRLRTLGNPDPAPEAS